MSVEERTIPREVLQRVIWIQTLTLIWMSVEATVSLGAARVARSPALLAFGGDSAIAEYHGSNHFREHFKPTEVRCIRC